MRAISKKPVSRATHYALALCMTLLAGSGARAADDYLSAIEAEGNRMEFLGKARQEEEVVRRLHQTGAAPAAPTPVAAQATVAPTSMRGFEDQLRSQFPGSFALYSLMDTKEREMVFAEFGKSKSTGAARFLPVVSKIIGITTQKRAKGI
jgi:hypothetical protein